MADNKDKSERLKYLNEEKDNQINKKSFYNKRIVELKDLIIKNEKEIEYNEKWIVFHEESIKKHKEEIKNTAILDEKIDQERKLKFHLEQIENHHKEYIKYHEKEIEFAKKEILLYKEGLVNTEKQLDFLNEKIAENKI
jgi:hypothetical protein